MPNFVVIFIFEELNSRRSAYRCAIDCKSRRWQLRGPKKRANQSKWHSLAAQRWRWERPSRQIRRKSTRNKNPIRHWRMNSLRFGWKEKYPGATVAPSSGGKVSIRPALPGQVANKTRQKTNRSVNMGRSVRLQLNPHRIESVLIPAMLSSFNFLVLRG